MKQYSTFSSGQHEIDLNRAIVHHEKLVRWVVNRQRWEGLAWADVLQVGRIGLWRALQRYEPERGTAFSAVDGPDGLSVAATYRNQVALSNVVYGDLFTVLDIDFSSATSENGGFGANSTLTFTADTDNTSLAGDIKEIPEPTSMALLGLGLLGLVFMRRKA